MSRTFRKPISDFNDKLSEFESKLEEVSIIRSSSSSSSSDKNRRRTKETDYHRELRFSELRNARREEREKNPERYPPTKYWWGPSEQRRCHYFPKDIPTEEEVEFYEQIASDYLNHGKAYRFHTYDTFLAYNAWSLEELDRWNDYLEFGHIHSLNETLDQWKAHTTDEHHLHKEPPMAPRGWDPDYLGIKDLIKRQTEHLSRINNNKKLSRD